MRLWLLALALGGGAAAARDDNPLRGAGLDGPSLQLFESASEAEDGGDCARAVRAYGLVIKRDPGYVPAVLGRARCLEALGRTEQALAAYRLAPMESEAVRAMGRILSELGEPEAAAAQYLLLQKLELGEPEPYLLEAGARLEAGELGAAVDGLERYFVLADGGGDGGREDLDAGARDLVVALSRAFYDADRPAEAARWCERYLEEWPGGEQVEAVETMLDRLAVEQAAGELFPVIAEPLPERARPILEQARRLVAEGRYGEARRQLEGLRREHERAPEVWAALGELHLARGEASEAEVAWGYAVGLAPDEPTYRVRLAELLREHYGGREHRRAAEELRLALAARPTWYELHFRLGVIQQELRDFDGARAAFQAYLKAEPGGPHAAEASERLLALRRRPPPPPDLDPFRTQRPAEVPEEAWTSYKIARIYLGRGDLERAREEIEGVLALAPQWSLALRDLATLQRRAGDEAAALETYARILELDPGDRSALMELAEAAAAGGRGDEAAALYRRAADAGSVQAWFELARIAAEEGRWQRARELLDAYAARSGPPREEATALRATLERRRRLLVGGGVAAGLLALGLPLGFVLRRRSGGTLRELLEHSPESFQDVAVILSAMRHEVLKHNTTVLPSVADGLEVGDRGLAVEAAGRLLGRGGEPGVVARWFAYIGELEALGRRVGLRLNLRHRDPELAPMCAAFRDLARLEGAMRRGRAAAAPRLRAISEALNETGYRALGRLIREVCVLRVDAGLLRGCWERVCEEPAHALAELPELELRVEPEGGGGYPVRIPQRDLEDILGNVLRNSLAAVLEDGSRLGVELALEEDWVTGLESVCIRVLDDSPQPLTDAMIRGRYIERGFGITVDLISRHGGSIQVEEVAGEGWAKAVALRLPLAEAEEGR